MDFPFPCCRCGYCCMVETCPAGMEVYGVPKKSFCPGLQLNPDGTTTCILVSSGTADATLMGMGAGCCIKATAVNSATGFGVDFASLPNLFKIAIARRYAELTEAGHGIQRMD